jgi:hypothetical protein
LQLYSHLIFYSLEFYLGLAVFCKGFYLLVFVLQFYPVGGSGQQVQPDLCVCVCIVFLRVHPPPRNHTPLGQIREDRDTQEVNTSIKIS